MKKKDHKSANSKDQKAAHQTAKKQKSAPKYQKISVKKIDQVKQQIQALKQKNDHLDDQYLRAEAEMQNVQKHAAQDQDQIIKYSGQKLAKGILPGLDNLKRALSVKVSDKNGQQLKQGVQMVYKRLLHALSVNHIKEVKVAGKKFDPQFAEAVQTVPADKKHPADQIVKVLQPGYQIHDRLLRPAMVIVAK